MKELNEAVAKRVLGIVDKGLVSGIGNPVPGQMCVEAAVCFAMGLPHSDDPPCVGRAVRAFKIKLNDSCWSSCAARAKGMRKLAIAQLGSDRIDQVMFAKILADQTVSVIVPRALRIAAKVNPKHAVQLEDAAVRCEVEGSSEMCRLAAEAAEAAEAGNNAGATAASKAVMAARMAVRAAHASAEAAHASTEAAYASTEAAYASAEAAHASTEAANYADADADADAAADAELTLMADIGLAALIKLNSPGCAFLHLCEA
jgi:hypothetical protein